MRAGKIRCEGRDRETGEACKNVLGQWAAGYVLVIHDGREWLGAPISITCEECRWTWRPPDDEPRRAIGPVGRTDASLAAVS